jgi:hypothetical protein
MPEPFFGREIKVVVGGELREPLSFRLGDKEYQIAEVVAMWQDYGFGKVHPRRPKWWQRHHRSYYRVRTTEGEVYEIYYERGTSLRNPRFRRWYISRRVYP